MDDYTPIINIKVIEWLSSTSKKNTLYQMFIKMIK